MWSLLYSNKMDNDNPCLYRADFFIECCKKVVIVYGGYVLSIYWHNIYSKHFIFYFFIFFYVFLELQR